MLADQAAALSRYLRQEIAAHSPYYRSILAPMVGQLTALKGRSELTALPFTTLDQAGALDPSALVLRPDRSSIRAGGDLKLVARLSRQRVIGREWKLALDIVDPLYKPVLWTIEAGLLVGSSSADLTRLADLGRRALEAGGVRPSDVLVSLLPPGPTIASTELCLGARLAGIPTLSLDPSSDDALPDRLAQLVPSVLAGRSTDLERLFLRARREGVTLDAVRVVIVVGDEAPLDERGLIQLQSLLGAGTEVVVFWAPPGVRSLWTQCVGGTGLHVWPEAEAIEVIDPVDGFSVTGMGVGEVVWTGIGWRGTALVRLRTGWDGHLEETTCPTCGRETPRLRLEPAVRVDPAHRGLAAILDEHPDIEEWQAELRTVGNRDELLVFLAPGAGHALDRLLLDLEREVSATQYVIVDRASLATRRIVHGDQPVLDRR